MNPSNAYLVRLAPGNTGFDSPWLDCQRVESISLNAGWSDNFTGYFVVEGSDNPGETVPLDITHKSQYSLPTGCLHPSKAGIVLGAFAPGFGKPVEITAVAAGAFLLELTNQSRWLRVKLVNVAGGGLFDWYITYTLRFYK